MTTELAIREGQSTFDGKQLAALEQLGVANASRADQAIFFHQCVRTGLDPFARQIYMIERQGKQTIQTGIDGFRLIARRAVDRQRQKLGYAEPQWCGPEGKWVDVWLNAEPPLAAKVTVYRDGEPFPAVALLREFRQTRRDGTPNSQWASRPAHMLAKCAEALALRMAFPQDLSGLYTTDEMGTPEPGEAPTTPDGGTQRVGRRRPVEPVPDAAPDSDGLDEFHPDTTHNPDGPAPSITRQQQAALMASFNEAGITDRTDRLLFCSDATARTIDTTNALTRDEAKVVLDLVKNPGYVEKWREGSHGDGTLPVGGQ
jgi:phage recombination protein Bet